MNTASWNIPEISEITEESDEGIPCTINTKAQKDRIRQIIEYQKHLYLSSSSASSSSFSSSSRRNGLLEMMRGGSTSLRRSFDMEHTSLGDHFRDYSGSPVIKPILLWGSDTDDVYDGSPFWRDFRQSGAVKNIGSEDLGGDYSEGSFKEGEIGYPEMFCFIISPQHL